MNGVGFTTMASPSPLGRPFSAGTLRPDGDLGRCPGLAELEVAVQSLVGRDYDLG